MAYVVGKDELIAQYKMKLQELNEQIEKAKNETKAVKYENMRLNIYAHKINIINNYNTNKYDCQ